MTRTLRVAVACALLAVASGCNRPRAQGGHSPGELVWIARMVQGDFACARIDSMREVLPGVVQVRGCGTRREYQFERGWRNAHPIASVESRASLELSCSASQLEVVSPAPAVRGVIGCGRRARYDLVCARGAPCTWTMTAHAGDWRDLVGPSSVPAGAWIGAPAALPAAPPASPSFADRSVQAPALEDLSAFAIPPAPGAVPPAPGTPP